MKECFFVCAFVRKKTELTVLFIKHLYHVLRCTQYKHVRLHSLYFFRLNSKF
jgi:hypothetical protein